MTYLTSGTWHLKIGDSLLTLPLLLIFAFIFMLLLAPTAIVVMGMVRSHLSAKDYDEAAEKARLNGERSSL